MSTDAPEAPVNLFDPKVAACPHAAYKALRETGQGITRLPVVGIPLITRYDDVMYVLRHPELFSSEMEEQLSLGTERPMIPQQIDPPAQTRYRRLLDPLFSLRRSNDLAPKVREQANLLIDKFIDDGQIQFAAINASLHHFQTQLALGQLNDGIPGDARQQFWQSPTATRSPAASSRAGCCPSRSCPRDTRTRRAATRSLARCTRRYRVLRSRWTRP